MKKIRITLGILISIGLLAVIAIIAWGGANNSTEPAWQTYANETYGFSVRYPSDWAVYEGEGADLSPKINIYKPGENASSPPFDHHSDATQVSFFPKGVPTEGVFGASATSTVSAGEEIRSAMDFLLENGNPWGTIIYLKNNPASWREYGFVWISARIENGSVRCMRNDEELPPEACDTYSGDQIIRTGTVDAETRAIQERILETLSFTEK